MTFKLSREKTVIVWRRQSRSLMSSQITFAGYSNVLSSMLYFELLSECISVLNVICITHQIPEYTLQENNVNESVSDTNEKKRNQRMIM